MTNTQQKLIQALIKCQVAVLEWGEEPCNRIGPSEAIKALDQSFDEVKKLVKQLKKDDA